MGGGGGGEIADLANDRIIDEPPFTNCGVDMFGLFLLKEGRKELRRYRALLHAYLVGQSILNALVAWKQILSYKFCDDLLHKEETLECYVVTMVLILWEHRKNWKRHTVKWIIRRFNSSFRTLVLITLIGIGTPPASSHMGSVWERQIRLAHTILMSLLHTHMEDL